MQTTTAVDVLLVAYEALGNVEKDAFDERLAKAQVARLASRDEGLARLLDSIKAAADHVGCEPRDLTVTHYRRADRERDDIEPLSRIMRRFGSWRQAREALLLSQEHSLRVVERRLEQRSVKAKIWRYSLETLRDFFAEAVESYGRVPMASELDDYRRRRLEVARAQGDDALHLPQAGAYRRRFGTYEAACLALGYTPDQVEERLEHGGRS